MPLAVKAHKGDCCALSSSEGTSTPPTQAGMQLLHVRSQDFLPKVVLVPLQRRECYEEAEIIAVLSPRSLGAICQRIVIGQERTHG